MTTGLWRPLISGRKDDEAASSLVFLCKKMPTHIAQCMEYDVPFGAVILTQRVHTPLLPSFFSVRTSGMSAPRATSDVDGSVLETELERIMEVEVQMTSQPRLRRP